MVLRAILGLASKPETKAARSVQGLNVTVEHPKHTVRELRDDNDQPVYKKWMFHDYGFINDTKGRDGDEVDCFIGPSKNAKNAYIVHMLDKGTEHGKEDEDKCMLGFDSAVAAKQAFLLHYPASFFGGMTELPLDTFKEKLAKAQLPYREKKIHAGGPGSGRHPGVVYHHINDYPVHYVVALHPDANTSYGNRKFFDGKLPAGFSSKNVIGHAEFYENEPSKYDDWEPTYSSHNTAVDPKWQRQGVATGIYQHFKDLGNTIRPHDESLSDEGSKMWRHMHLK